jgi:cobalt-zinc-cadmium efflux system outer membrane protein
MRLGWLIVGCVFEGCLAANAAAQAPLTWTEVRARFETNNPTVRAGQLGIDEARADEVTAFLRPNPDVSVTNDQMNLFKTPPDGSRIHNLVTIGSVSYLRERAGKRELRRDSAQGATAIATSSQADLVRTLTFSLRGAFVQLLQAKAFLALAQAELTDYDRVLAVSRDRLQAGDIAQIDFDRLQLQRVQYESDVQTATVNLRTAKIQLLALLNDQRTPVEQLDVTGPYDFSAPMQTLDALRQIALQTRPDLKAALEAIEKARTDKRLAIANGSTDPVVSADVGWPQSPESFSPPVNLYFGASVSIPLRIFDRNQGEKLKTALDVTRHERLADAARVLVFSDVDSAYATLTSTVALLQPYKTTYLVQSTRVRDTMSFSYQRGGASLIDFLQAQQEYRTVQISYVNLIGAFLNAVSQLNLAIGQEVIQ